MKAKAAFLIYAIFYLFLCYLNYYATMAAWLGGFIFPYIGPYLLQTIGFTRRGVGKGTVASYFSTAAKKTRLSRKIFGTLQSIGISPGHVKLTALGGFVGSSLCIVTQFLLCVYKTV